MLNVQLPAKTIQFFYILVSIVSFDYFPLTDHFDLGFTETEPWSDKFVLLQYETINFIEGMGSIMILMWLGFIYLLMVLISNLLK